MHNAVFSPDEKYFVDTYSQVNVPPVTVLRETASGEIYMPVETADITDLKKAGWSEPIPFTAKGRDGKTDMWGVIVTPSNFDPSKKYPVLEYIYAGPGSHYAPKVFSSSLRLMHNTAEIGFVVVMLDAMGTSFRSKAFEEVCWRNLKDAGFPDRIAWIKAAGKKYPWMDIDKVGLFGGSAGGQNAMCGVLYHPEFYKAAYAGCGCHDNRMDKIWWNEQWMGYPVGPHYAENSNVENAWRLTRPLMLMVGEVDDNVDPATTLQVVKALQKAGKEFELVVVPSANHTLGGTYGDRKRLDFFLKQFYGINPPDWNIIAYPPKSGQ
jgi:dipeptidyl aminopeptidase/acylaminoacyl peptidase